MQYAPSILATTALLIGAVEPGVARTLEFRVPVQVSDIRNLDRITMDCTISKSPLRTEIDDEVDYSGEATLRGSRTLTLDDVSGGSWRGVIEVGIGDGSEGGISLDEGRHYVCKLSVGYLKTGDRADEVFELSDLNCDHEVQYVDAYRDSMNADIAEHVLCRQAPLDTGTSRVDVGSMYLRGGRPTADEMIMNLTSLTTIEPRSKRTGPRYASFEIDGNIEECALACVRDEECRSWSGWETQGGRCFLSSAVLPPTAVDSSLAYSGRIGQRETTVTPEDAAPGALDEQPVSDVTDAVAAAMEAAANGDACRGAEILSPFLDDPQARSMHRELQAVCE